MTNARTPIHAHIEITLTWDDLSNTSVSVNATPEVAQSTVLHTPTADATPELTPGPTDGPTDDWIADVPRKAAPFADNSGFDPFWGKVPSFARVNPIVHKPAEKPLDPKTTISDMDEWN